MFYVDLTYYLVLFEIKILNKLTISFIDYT